MDLPRPIQVQIAAVAEEMLSGEEGIVGGCRKLVQLLSRLDERDDKFFAPIVAVESETDDLPLGEARSLWSEEALANKEAEVGAYVDQVRGVILEICRELVQRYSAAVR